MLYIEKEQVVSSDGETKEIERIFVHRGDRGSMTYSIEQDDETDYEFKTGDVLEFTVFERKGYDKIPVINKTITIEQPTTEVEILLTEEDTTIGDAQNKPVTYWYEISLNGNQTINGYDYEEGALEFILLPAKAGEE